MRRTAVSSKMAMLIVCSLASTVVPNRVEGVVPHLLNLQGRLAQATGSPVPDSTYAVKFAIFAESGPGGTSLWEETQAVDVRDGLFSVDLGSTAPQGVGIPDSAFNGDRRWLAITVGNDPEMSPRIRLTSQTYSYRVSTVEGASGGNIYGDLTLHSTFTTGEIVVTDKAAIGPGSSNTGAYAFAVGNAVTASGYAATASGGAANAAVGTYSTVSGGSGNSASGYNATVGGGSGSLASADQSTVGGGYQDTASGMMSTIAGGAGNRANGYQSTVSGGGGNAASGDNATVGGGRYNQARGHYSVVSGGGGLNAADSNAALGVAASIGGGYANVANGNESTIGGGRINHANGQQSTIGGGGNNTAGPVATVGGGAYGVASGLASTISGGEANVATAQWASVGGGSTDSATGVGATVPGGLYNVAGGEASLAAGSNAKARHDGCFVWADDAAPAFASSAANQFLIRARGGVGIGTSAPRSALDIQDGTGASGSGGRIHIGTYSASGDEKLIHFGDTSISGASYVYVGERGADDRLELKGAAIYLNPSILAGVGIGVAAPAHPLEMASGAYCSASGVWTNASSRRFKTDIEPLDSNEYANVLQELQHVDVVRFKYKKDSTRAHLGLIAEDVPDEMASDDRVGIPTADAIAFLMAAVKAQQAQIEALRETVRSLKQETTR